jgi:hypothetical protein
MNRASRTACASGAAKRAAAVTLGSPFDDALQQPRAATVDAMVARHRYHPSGGQLMTTTDPTQTASNSADTNSFKGRARQQLAEVRASVDRTLEDVQAAGSRTADDLKARRDAAQAATEARRQEIENANAKMKAGVEAKKAGADNSVADWKAKLNIQRLEHRAVLAEDYATAVTVIAGGALEEANLAIYDAMIARADVEVAKAQAILKS